MGNEWVSLFATFFSKMHFNLLFCASKIESEIEPHSIPITLLPLVPVFLSSYFSFPISREEKEEE